MTSDGMTWCDRCGPSTSGKVEWWKPEGWARLLMCIHHAKIHAPAMRAQGWMSHADIGIWEEVKA